MSRTRSDNHPDPIEVKSISIGTLSTEDIIHNSSAAIVNNRNSVASSLHNTNTLEDDRLYPMRSRECITCGKYYSHRDRSMECPGHWGYIPLSYPIPSPVFYKGILDILKCICIECSNLRIPEDNAASELLNMPKSGRLEWVKDRTKTYRVCSSCSAQLPKKIEFKLPELPHASFIKKHGIRRKDGLLEPVLSFYELQYPPWGDRKTMKISYINNKDLHAVFSNIKTSSLRYIGLAEGNRPENMILMAVPVIPPPCRLPHKSGRDQNANHLTSSYNSILVDNKNMGALLEGGRNESIRRQKNKSMSSRRSLTARDSLRSIYMSICSIMCDGKKESSNSRRAVTLSIGASLGEKKGLVKGDCVTKRCDNSARTVITAGPSMDIDQIGVPKCIAENTFLIEHVFSANLDHVRSLVRRGKVNLIFPTDGRPYSPLVRDEWDVQIGYRVRRQVLDDDFCIVLRNPILMLGSMLGVRVKVTKGDSIQLPLAITTPLAADFDGKV